MPKSWLIMSVTFLLLLQGCYTGRYITTEPFDDEQLIKIKHGITTKKDLLKWLGAPAFVAQKGEIVTVYFGSNRVFRPESLNDFLKSSKVINKNQLVYFYYYLEDKEIGLILDSKATIYYNTNVYNLWFLINTENGLVEDYFAIKEDVDWQ